MSQPTYHAPALDLWGAEHVRRSRETGGDRTIPPVGLSPARGSVPS
jgi:hypothetical protein